MRLLQVQVARPSDEDRVTASIVRAFMNDPAARWMYPDPAQNLENFPKFVGAFGGRAFESGMVHHAGTFQGAALWLPPDVYPDEDAIIELISGSVPERDQSAMFSVFDRMEQYHPPQPHLAPVADRGRASGAGEGPWLSTLASCARALRCGSSTGLPRKLKRAEHTAL